MNKFPSKACRSQNQAQLTLGLVIVHQEQKLEKVADWKQGNKSKYSQICVISSKNQYFMKNIAKECHIYDKYLFCNKFTSLFINPPFSWFSPHKQLALYLICYENCFIFI